MLLWLIGCPVSSLLDDDFKGASQIGGEEKLAFIFFCIAPFVVRTRFQLCGRRSRRAMPANCGALTSER